MNKTVRILIDGDIIVYKAAFAVEKKCWVGLNKSGTEVQVFEKGTRKTDAEKTLQEGLTLARKTMLEPINNACQVAKTMINRICGNIKKNYPGEVICTTIVLSDLGKKDPRYTWAISKPYKGNRTQPRPVHFEAIRNYLISQFGAIVASGEADETICWEAEFKLFKKPEIVTIIAGIDKDLLMIPGIHYHIDKESVYNVPGYLADYVFYKLLLTGDTSDNVPGVPKLGKKSAEKLLKVWDENYHSDMIRIGEDLHNAAMGAYIQANLSPEYFIEQGKLLWLRRTPDEEWKGEYISR